jgi:dienelactone hydrolase
MNRVVAALLVCSLAGAAQAAVKMETVEYRAGDTVLKGQIAWDDAATGKRPAVIVVHEWWGLNDYAKKRAMMLAEAGYVAFAADMYGDGRTTEHPNEAGAWATAVRQNQEAGNARFLAAVERVKSDRRVDPEHISAIGYCFGGSVVLGAAFSGMDLDAVASFHGGLSADPAGGKVTARILVCHGAADSFMPAETVAAFQKVLAESGADYQFIAYGGAKHGFTNPDAGKFGLPGLAYDENADRRSWQALLAFLAEGAK